MGIFEPKEIKSNKENEAELVRRFLESVNVNSDGRYEEGLTWLDGHPLLANNFHSGKKCLDYLEKKFKQEGHYESYNNVFNECPKQTISEAIPEQDIEMSAY